MKLQIQKKGDKYRVCKLSDSVKYKCGKTITTKKVGWFKTVETIKEDWKDSKQEWEPLKFEKDIARVDFLPVFIALSSVGCTGKGTEFDTHEKAKAAIKKYYGLNGLACLEKQPTEWEPA